MTFLLLCLFFFAGAMASLDLLPIPHSVKQPEAAEASGGIFFTFDKDTSFVCVGETEQTINCEAIVLDFVHRIDVLHDSGPLPLFFPSCFVLTSCQTRILTGSCDNSFGLEIEEEPVLKSHERQLCQRCMTRQRERE
jgi:hypothetical protein